jgi:hypothetical protein
MQWLRRRIVFFTAITWLPLLLLSIFEGHAWGEGVRIPFLYDVGAQVRFLLVVPLLLLAEVSVHLRMRPLVRLFRERGLVPEAARGEFDAAVASAIRLRNSIPAELLLLGWVYVVVFFVWRRFTPIDSGWYGERVEGGLHLSAAGWWLGCVSLPIIQFLLLRWYFRLCIWLRLLWRISRIELHLLPTHPDRAGGLGFLGALSFAFAPLLFAQGALVSGSLATRIFFGGSQLTDFKPEIAGLLVAVMISVLGPVLVFIPALARVKRVGLRDYGNLAQRYVNEFDRKWLKGGAPADEPLVGSADIQSLADLIGSYDAVKDMSPVPVNLRTMIMLVLMTLLPIAPLILTMVSLPELVQRVLQVVL